MLSNQDPPQVRIIYKPVDLMNNTVISQRSLSTEFLLHHPVFLSEASLPTPINSTLTFQPAVIQQGKQPSCAVSQLILQANHKQTVAKPTCICR